MADAAGIRVATIAKNPREQSRVTVETYMGRELVSCRVWFRSEAGDFRPGREGFTLKVEALPQFLKAVQAAHEQAMRQGLIGGGA